MSSSSSEHSRKYKKPKQNTFATTNPGPSGPRFKKPAQTPKQEPLCPLLAKDSEWVDILQTTPSDNKASASVSDEEEVLQLVDCEDGPQMRPLAIMFPGLLDKDPQTLQGMLTKAMSTTEVTRHLVDLGQKANFTFMKKADRLIPPERKWLDSLAEDSNSVCSLDSRLLSSSCTISSDYEADGEITDDKSSEFKVRKKRKHILNPNHTPHRE